MKSSGQGAGSREQGAKEGEKKRRKENCICLIVSTDERLVGEFMSLRGRFVASLQANLGLAQSNLGPAQPNLGLAQAKLGLAQPNLGLVQANLGPAQPNLGLAQAKLGPAQPNLGLVQANLGLLQPKFVPRHRCSFSSLIIHNSSFNSDAALYAPPEGIDFYISAVYNIKTVKTGKRRLKMIGFIKKVTKKIAQPPGTLIHVGEKKIDTVKLSLIRYNKDILEEKEMESPCDCLSEKDFKGICWVNVSGIHDAGIIEQIGNNFGLHPLVMEDILNTLQRPKQENLEDYIFVVLKMLYYDNIKKEVLSEHVSFILGSNFVVTFQEREEDVFNPVRERI